MPGAIGTARFQRRRKRVITFVSPVFQKRLETGEQCRRVETLRKIRTRGDVSSVVATDENIDGPVAIHGAEHLVEIDPAVKESPCDIPHHGPQKIAHIDDIGAFWVGHPDEIFIPLKFKAADFKTVVPVSGISDRAVRVSMHYGRFN